MGNIASIEITPPSSLVPKSPARAVQNTSAAPLVEATSPFVVKIAVTLNQGQRPGAQVYLHIGPSFKITNVAPETDKNIADGSITPHNTIIDKTGADSPSQPVWNDPKSADSLLAEIPSDQAYPGDDSSNQTTIAWIVSLEALDQGLYRDIEAWIIYDAGGFDRATCKLGVVVQSLELKAVEFTGLATHKKTTPPEGEYWVGGKLENIKIRGEVKQKLMDKLKSVQVKVTGDGVDPSSGVTKTVPITPTPDKENHDDPAEKNTKGEFTLAGIFSESAFKAIQEKPVKNISITIDHAGGNPISNSWTKSSELKFSVDNIPPSVQSAYSRVAGVGSPQAPDRLTLTLRVTDTESGVLKVEYAPNGDEEKNWHSLSASATHPPSFIIEPVTTEMFSRGIIIRATDNVANTMVHAAGVNANLFSANWTSIADVRLGAETKIKLTISPPNGFNALPPFEKAILKLPDGLTSKSGESTIDLTTSLLKKPGTNNQPPTWTCDSDVVFNDKNKVNKVIGKAALTLSGKFMPGSAGLTFTQPDTPQNGKYLPSHPKCILTTPLPDKINPGNVLLSGHFEDYPLHLPLEFKAMVASPAPQISNAKAVSLTETGDDRVVYVPGDKSFQVHLSHIHFQTNGDYTVKLQAAYKNDSGSSADSNLVTINIDDDVANIEEHISVDSSGTKLKATGAIRASSGDKVTDVAITWDGQLPDGTSTHQVPVADANNTWKFDMTTDVTPAIQAHALQPMVFVTMNGARQPKPAAFQYAVGLVNVSVKLNGKAAALHASGSREVGTVSAPSDGKDKLEFTFTPKFHLNRLNVSAQLDGIKLTDKVKVEVQSGSDPRTDLATSANRTANWDGKKRTQWLALAESNLIFGKTYTVTLPFSIEDASASPHKVTIWLSDPEEHIGSNDLKSAFIFDTFYELTVTKSPT